MAPLFRQKQQWLLVILRKVLSTLARTCRCCSVLGLTSIETTLVNIAFHRFQQTTPPFLACEKNHITHCRTVCTCILDFFFANGGLGPKRFEMLSYLTDDKKDGNVGDYAVPPGTLPVSETQGYGELLPKGNCFSNVPDMLEDYIPRKTLEDELHRLLLDERRPIVTLV